MYRSSAGTMLALQASSICFFIEEERIHTENGGTEPTCLSPLLRVSV